MQLAELDFVSGTAKVDVCDPQRSGFEVDLSFGPRIAVGEVLLYDQVRLT